LASVRRSARAGVVDAQTVQVFAGFVDIDAGPLFEPDALR
jgi:hypothetical protein